MKVLKSRVVLFISSLFLCLTVFSQINENPYSGGIIAGSNRWFLISFMHQEPVKAKILRLEGDMITMIRRNGNTQVVNRNSIINIEEIPFGTIGSAGVGLGIPYGILGLNLELNALPLVSLSAGLGTSMVAGIGWSVGARGYFRKPGQVWRPRVSVFYGVNTVYVPDGSNSGDSYQGLTVGAGQVFLWQKHGFDFDLMYIVNSKRDEIYSSDYVKIKINIGYRLAF